MPMSNEQKEKLASELKEISKEGKIACSQALDLAKRLGVDSRLVGEMASEMKIKIVGCQLGCFG